MHGHMIPSILDQPRIFRGSLAWMISRRWRQILPTDFVSTCPNGAPPSVLADKLFDAALQLALLLLALAQPLFEIRDGEFEPGLTAERNADKIVAPPDDFGE